jgi:hypothetical protein
MSQTEQPKYTVIDAFGKIEIRQYAPMIVAETQVAAGRKDAIQQGFRTIAAYIFGGNANARKIAMTAPVIQQALENADPPTGTGQPVDRPSWRVRFVMPRVFALDALPAPLDPAVKLLPLQARRYVVIQFSGSSNDDNIRQHHDMLRNHVLERRLNVTGEPVLAFYNPPWTLPFLRRNEIWLALAG